jgi:hypothetical protein
VNDMLRQALAYAAGGWPVFPCRPGRKVPAFPAAHEDGDPARVTCRGECGRYGHGFRDATTDPGVIRSWWRRWPAANVAIATGDPGPDVLDVDVHPEGNGWEAFNRLKRAGLLTGATALVRTRSGGLHAYFAGTGQPCGKLARHHLDFKAAGGYVIAPPSWVGADDRGPAGRYEVIDHREGTARLDWQAARELLEPSRPRRQDRERPAPGDIAGLIRTVGQARPGNRNNVLFWAACCAAKSGADPEPLVAAAVAAGLPEQEARRTVASAGRRAAS